MAYSMEVYTSWDVHSRSGRLVRSIMIVGFQPENTVFTFALDSVLKPLLNQILSNFSRYVYLLSIIYNGTQINLLRHPLEAFHLRPSVLERLVPYELREFFESYDYACAAALTDASTIEIMLLPEEPTEEVSHAFLDLSQSFLS